MYLCFLWFFSSNFVEELDGLTWLLFDIEAEGLACNSKVERVRCIKG
jgi:hypothetical protein